MGSKTKIDWCDAIRNKTQGGPRRTVSHLSLENLRRRKKWPMILVWILQLIAQEHWGSAPPWRDFFSPIERRLYAAK